MKNLITMVKRGLEMAQTKITLELISFLLELFQVKCVKAGKSLNIAF